ncbi:MAG: polyhydroxyalkanoic acid system family protein [Nanoarchaeota archaeon]
MRIDYLHNLTIQETYERINKLLPELQEEYSDKISDSQLNWNLDCTQMNFSMKVMGFKTSGQIHLKDKQISLEGKLPFVAKMFGEKIEEMIRKKLDELLS